MSVNENKLIIAAAGSGKTTFIVDQALKQDDGCVLITTYTLDNESEIRKKIIKRKKCVPEQIKVQTWFSFLLQHGVRPFQGYLYEKAIRGMVLVNQQSAPYTREADVEQYYFNNNRKIYSDKLSKFAVRCNELSGGAVIDRLSRIYRHIYFDEVQDLAGYDLDILKGIFASPIKAILVGDPRQVVYLTHHERKWGKYKDGKIKEFITSECKELFETENIDEHTLKSSHRNNKQICTFASQLYPDWESCEPCECRACRADANDHEGIFLVRQEDIKQYLKEHDAVQLRFNIRKRIEDDYTVKTFGDSKGLSFGRVLIYPTQAFINWLKDNNTDLAPTTRSKYYVAVTRAQHSVGIVFDYDDSTNIPGIQKYVE